MAFLEDAALAFVLVFLAELGDKTQLALVALSARGRAVRVWAGAAAALVLLAFVAAFLGDLLADRLPERAVAIAAGLLFLGFGVHALWRQEEEGPEVPPKRAGFGAAFLLMLVAEAGDKTQLAVATLGAREGPWVAAAIGGALALVAAAGLAVGLGHWLSERVAPRRIQVAAGILFLAAGLWFLFTAW